MAYDLSNVVVEPCQVLFDGADVGLTEGDIEIKPTEDSVDITGHQEGTNVLDSIRTGKGVGVSLTLKETALAKIASIVQAGGGASGSVAAVVAIEARADVGGDLNNKYFFISGANGVKFMVWFNVNGQGVAPVVADVTAVPVALATNANEGTVATAIATALDAKAEFTAAAVGSVVTVTNAAAGIADAPSAGNSQMAMAVATPGANTQYGWGKSKDFKSMLADAKKLVLHPVSEGATTNQAKDIAFWKAYPLLSSIVYSAENPKLVSIDFKIFPDSSKADAVRLFAFGAN